MYILEKITTFKPGNLGELQNIPEGGLVNLGKMYSGLAMKVDSALQGRCLLIQRDQNGSGSKKITEIEVHRDNLAFVDGRVIAFGSIRRSLRGDESDSFQERLAYAKYDAMLKMVDQ